MRYHFDVVGLMPHAIILAAMILAIPSVSFSAPRCGGTAELDQALSPAKGFIRLGRGETNDGTTIDIYVAPMTAAWVAVARLTSNRSCIITDGKNWRPDVHTPAPELPSIPGASS